MLRRLCLAVLLSALLGPAAHGADESPRREAAGTDRVVTSPAADSVALTVYRAPDNGGSLNPRYLAGFALVTETRKIHVPRGRSVLRFEGVAEGIIPVSAVIEGLPGGTIEKNRDARLLSPASLVDGSLGRQVTLTRTDKATGRKVSEQATLVAGPQQGVVLQTQAGIETLRCSGLPEKLAFDGVPPGLSSKPVLSVVTQGAGSRTVTVRLSYLSSGFDWRASYVATQAQDGRSLDLFAWLTLANGNPQTFDQAEVNAVAGRLNRVNTPAFRAAVAALRLACYPLGTTTSDLQKHPHQMAEIFVTGARVAPSIMMAAPAAPAPPPPPPPPPPEDLGDLKLYRVPERVTVSPKGQKQVALLSRSQVPFERRYRRTVYPGQALEAAPSAVVLVLRNRQEAGLGLALPAGSTALYAAGAGGERRLIGLGAIPDRAEGETFRLAAGTSTQVTISQQRGIGQEATLTVSNANGFPISIDVPIGSAGQKIEGVDESLERVDGVATWSPTVSPGATAQLRYRFPSN
jgi:hypothetical protein